ncbi:MAG: hypothetical protein JSW34_01305 [Candidatus Zixiibacteriota bacterium]|nr:MAG: hypothetical protein JSW34_01305 [candidate division Zixibacteria bacterium]
MSKNSKIIVGISLSANFLGVWGIVSAHLTGNQMLVGFKPVSFFLLFVGTGLLALQIYKILVEIKKTILLVQSYFTLQTYPVSRQIERLIKDAPYRLNYSRITLEYLDPNGKRVKIAKDQSFRVFSDGLSEMWDRGITLDPSQPTAEIEGVDNLRRFSTSVGTIQDVNCDGGKWNVLTRFHRTYNSGDTFDRTFGYTVLNCYLKEHENFHLSV